MFVSFQVTNTLGSTLNINDGAAYALQVADTHCEMSERPKTPKLQTAGNWPVFTYARARIWHVEGEIIGTSMADYDAKRLNLVQLVMPQPPVGISSYRYTARIQVTDENGNSYQDSAASLTSYSMPVQALYPGIGPFMLEWESDNPFVIRLSDSANVFI
jgi:hypothetical protein